MNILRQLIASLLKITGKFRFISATNNVNLNTIPDVLKTNCTVSSRCHLASFYESDFCVLCGSFVYIPIVAGYFIRLLLVFATIMFTAVVKPGVFKHITCRNSVYPKSSVTRFAVPDELVFWSASYPEYLPSDYTSPHIHDQVWADPDINTSTFQAKWNSLDGEINRVSFNGTYDVVDGVPRNPIGRTGLKGRGLLGRWGPNHAADPVVTRWRRDSLGNAVINGEKRILQMVAIQRHDNQMWAIPGGMVDPGEKVSATLKREFMEEALDSFDKKRMIDDFFAEGIEIYKGYVDDFRNTDNAWMETVAYSFHDGTGKQVGKLQLSAGDDAANVKWMDISKDLKLHANHIDIVKQVVNRLNAHW